MLEGRLRARAHRIVDRLKAELPRRGRALARRLRARAIGWEEVWLTTSDGYRVYAHVHRPESVRGRLPAVVVVPGRDGVGTDFDSYRYPVSSDEIAALGALVLHYDPTGLGRSWGEEDSSGPAQQAALLAALEYVLGHPQVDREAVGVVTISLGLATAAPVLAREGARLGVAFLVDWEGPSDRHVITKFGQIMAPAMGHTLDDDTFWSQREPIRHIGRVPCAYRRFQSRRDHAQEEYVRHAVEMVNEAVRGGASPAVRLNDQPAGRTYDPDRPDPTALAPSGTAEANRRLLAAMQEEIEGARRRAG